MQLNGVFSLFLPKQANMLKHKHKEKQKILAIRHIYSKKKVADHETGQTDFFIFSRHDFSSSDMNQNCFSRRKQIITWIVKAENEKALMTSRGTAS